MIYSEQKTRSSVWNNFVLEKPKNVKLNHFVKSLLSHQRGSVVSSYLSLRSKRFRLVSEQKNPEKRDFRFGPREK